MAGLGVVGLEVAGIDVDGAAEIVGVDGRGRRRRGHGAGVPLDGCAGANNASTKYAWSCQLLVGKPLGPYRNTPRTPRMIELPIVCPPANTLCWDA